MGFQLESRLTTGSVPTVCSFSAEGARSRPKLKVITSTGKTHDPLKSKEEIQRQLLDCVIPLWSRVRTKHFLESATPGWKKSSLTLMEAITKCC